MDLVQNDIFTSAAKDAGFSSLAVTGLRSLAELRQLLGDNYSSDFICDMHQAAEKLLRDARLLEKKMLARQSPVLPALIRHGLKHPDVSVQDYGEWFGERFSEYTAPGDVSSVFSPAAYLTALYREAKALYPQDSRYHIDFLRPDLKNLVLSKDNMNKELSALSLSNEIMIALMKSELFGGDTSKPDDAALLALSDHVTSSGTPYHHHYGRLRQVRALKDPGFKQLLAAPMVTKYLSGPTLAGIYYDIPPALSDLLTETIPKDDNETRKTYNKYFPGMEPELVLSPVFLRAWYGLTDEEVAAFLALTLRGNYRGNEVITQYRDWVIKLGFTVNSGGHFYSFVYLIPQGSKVWEVRFSTTDKMKDDDTIQIFAAYGLRRTIRSIEQGDPVFLPGKEYRYRFEWGADDQQIARFEFLLYSYNEVQPNAKSWVSQFTSSVWRAWPECLQLNKFIRLYKATGLSPLVLEDIVTSADVNQQITDNTLSMLFISPLLAQRYGLPHEDTLVMVKGVISLNVHGCEASHWDRLFNTPPLTKEYFTPNSAVVLNVHPNYATDHADIKALLKRAFQTDDEGLYYLSLCLSSGNESTPERPTQPLGHKDVSYLYAMSLWSRAHGLTPQMLYRLLKLLDMPAEFYNQLASVWMILLDKLYSTLQWLSSINWSVSDLYLMTRDITTIPVGTEINNVITQLKDLVAAHPQVVEVNEQMAVMAPLLTGIFSLDHQTTALALLKWQHEAKTGGFDVSALWRHLRLQIDVEGNQLDDKPVVAFCYSLAQMALICHGTGIQPDALALFVRKPESLTTATDSGGLGRRVPVLMALCTFNQWRKTLQDSAGSGSALLAALQTEGVTAELLAQATGIEELRLQQAIDAAFAQGDIPATTLSSWQHIQVVLQWQGLAEVFSVTPTNISQMLKLDYNAKPRATWSEWAQVADTFVAGLTPAQSSRLVDNTSEALSEALAGYLTSGPKAIAGSRESLFQHLLADNLNGAMVKTSRLAGAIASLQQYIHRRLSLSPLDRGDPESADLQRAVLDRQFFRDWTFWNARYSTWAAGQKLMFYPENYIDPTVRLGQTTMMDEMLQTLGQAQINTDTVGDAFMGYLTGFEEVANLLTVSGYHDSPDPDKGKTWFVGRSQTEPREYWWRSVDEDKRSQEGTFPANAWTGWEKITCAPQVFGNLIRPVIFRDRLYVVWIERNRVVTARNDNGTETAWDRQWRLKVSWLRYDGTWNAPVSHEYAPSLMSELDTLLDREKLALPPEELSLYLSSWVEGQAIFASIYKKGINSDKDIFGEVAVYEDMTIKPSAAVSYNWETLRPFLDGETENRVVVPFQAADMYAEKTLYGASLLPKKFTRFDYSGLKISLVSENNERSEYQLNMGITMTVDAQRPEVENDMLRKLINYYPTLQHHTEKARAFYNKDFNGDAVLITTTEDSGGVGRGWCYLLIRPYNILGWKQIRDPSLEQWREIKYISWDLGFAKFEISDPDYPSELMGFNLRASGGDGYPMSISSLIGYAKYSDSRITPTLYVGESDYLIPKEQIKCTIIQDGVETSDKWREASSDIDLSQGTQSSTWSEVSTYPVNPEEKFRLTGNFTFHQVKLQCGTGNVRTWLFQVWRKKGVLVADVIGVVETNGERAQYLEHQQSNTLRTRLNTLFARQLTEKANGGIDAILNYRTQQLPEPPLKENGPYGVMDFSGANALYFWELFYYTPMMVMQRFLNEERYDLAEQWLKYIFSPSGYMVQGDLETRMWNVRPLEEDTGWNDDPLKSYDPDAVAQNDPMHYKLNAFMRLLDIVIGKGDAAYRKLERDTLAEAKVWYGRALSLLGDKPWIDTSGLWSNPTLKVAGAAEVQDDHVEALSAMLEGTPRPKERASSAVTGESLFLHEANEVMLGYWDILHMRQYNLRHNLTIDGQPMNLPLFAPPANPKALLAAAVAAEGGARNTLPPVTGIPVLRFTPMLESARSMASQLIQFGSSMQQTLVNQDAEALAELLATQGAGLADSSLTLQHQVLNELAAERITLEKSLETATARCQHYQALYQENINSREMQAMNLLTASRTLSAGIKPLYVAGAVAGVAPNIFGLANGGMEYEGPLNAAGMGMEIAASALEIASRRIEQEEMYRRRRQEWDIQYQSAEKEMAVIQAQLDALAVRQTSAEMQIAHAETQTAQALAQLALFQNKLTGKAMYSWLRGRLATIYYQYYDLTASLCLMAQHSLQYETGDTTTSWLKTGTWHGAWAGLMAGEGLMLSLGQMELAWMKHQKRELEVTRTVSLAAFLEGKLIREGEDTGAHSLSEAINALLLAGVEDAYGVGLNKVVLEAGNQLAVHFSLKDLALTEDYQGRGRIRSIAVTLPALLGAYEDVRGLLRTNVDSNLLPSGCNECAISHALRDNGMFAQDGTGDPRWGARWLPFEGVSATDDRGMTLCFTEATGKQKSLLASLSDIILHIQFTVRTGA